MGRLVFVDLIEKMSISAITQIGGTHIPYNYE